jgi:hypothetical protein
LQADRPSWYARSIYSGGIGVQYIPKLGYLYYTATARQLFMRVKVDPNTCDPVGEPELVGEGRMFDDFCLDQDAGYAYLTTHRQNTIERLSLEPTKNNAKTISIAGDPFTPALIGPSAGHWGRGQGEYGPDRILHDGWRYGLATRGRSPAGQIGQS